MAHRNIHYEAAFEDFLRAKGWPYVAVDETKRAIFADVSIKSFDFLVYSSSGPNLLVDVKGRKFPDLATGKGTKTRSWENWITRQDIEGLQLWQKVFGDGFMPVLVFAYWLQGHPHQSPFNDVHLFRQEHYAFVAIGLEDYLAASRPRSARWQTIAMPSAQFARQARDIATFL
ncbi:MAG: HYExAFE family protein [Phycisphaerae bacterium]